MSQYNKFMVFIDGSNVFHGCRDLKFQISYEKFLPILKEDKNVIRVFFYSGVKPPVSNEKKFLKMLGHLEMEITTKLLKTRSVRCNSCKKVAKIFTEKGIDASLSTDLLWYAFQNAYETAIIVTGDADFIPPIERVRLMGKRIELWAFKHSIGNELKSKVDKVNYIDDIINKIKKK